MPKRDIVVIGASAGGIIALVEFLKCIPEDFDGYIFVVQHLSPFSPSVLPQILGRVSTMKAVHPRDGEVMKKNTIYVAPPDHHLLLENDQISIKKGPKENRFRPSIDALFRSAAYTYGPRVVGIVLSGLLDDGTSGLWSVKRHNGLCVIQDPEEAEFPSMPLNVLEYVDVDYSVPICEMGSLVSKLTAERAPEKTVLSESEIDLLKTEVNIAAQDNAFDMGVLDKGALTPLTCPECSGAMVQVTEGKIVRYRCHTGHGFTDSALLAGVTKAVEDNMWKCVRGMEEAIMILERTARQYEQQGKEETASLFYRKAKETHDRTRVIRNHIFEQEKLSEDIRFNGAPKENGVLKPFEDPA
ncbi:MAG TPA: chemotaxis protein CheB [Flavisolibacter sp.]|jgi:two-component system chemotaxis response regulator CheB